MRVRTLISACLVLSLAGSGMLVAQGVQSGTLKGVVKSDDGDPLPGVSVTIKSAALQGERNAITGATGEFIVRNLPKGNYEGTFELDGMATVVTPFEVRVGGIANVNIQMKLASVEETIQVTAELPGVLTEAQVSTHYDYDLVNQLAIPQRDPDSIAQLAPGVTDNTPNGGQVSISGSFAYDNVFLIDGVDANDNLFGNTNAVFIEEAIEDLQVLTSGISAEYGRFSGGIVNVITKTGGNEFHGSLRADLENNDWRNRTPLEVEDNVELESDVQEVYSGTLGGYILKDRLWFFGAARDEESSTQALFARTSLPRTSVNAEDRQEIKATLNLANSHQVQAQFTDRANDGTRPSFGFSITPDTFRNRVDPSDLKVGRYNGVLTSDLFVEAQYSEKQSTFDFNIDVDPCPPNCSVENLMNSPNVTFFSSPQVHYGTAYFGEDEDRNNEQTYAALSYFLESQGAGSHDLKFGFEDFTTNRMSGNTQSRSGYVFSATPLGGGASPTLDANNRAIPVWQPATGANPDPAVGPAGFINFRAVVGSNIDIQTQSAYIRDSWRLNDNWSFNLGFRYEQVDSEATGGIVTVDTDRIVPRLSATFDPRGNGKDTFFFSFAQYSGKYSESQFAENTSVGNPPLTVALYVGPFGQGFDFLPAYDLNNYLIIDADDGTQNIFVDPDIQSPIVDEFTISYGRQFRRGGFLRAVYTDREYSDFVEDFVTLETGTTDVVVDGFPVGTFNNTFYTNSDEPTREYQAIQLIGRYRVTDKITINGNYTLQLTNDGNFEGEGTNTPGVSSTFGDYPGVFVNERHFPDGRLNDFQRHKVRAWLTYPFQIGRAGTLTVGGLMNFESGRVFSTTSRLTTFTGAQQAILGLYDSQPTSQVIFYGNRGDIEFDDALTLDLSVNYQLPIYKELDLWIRADVINVLDDDTQTSGLTSNAVPNFNGPLDSLGLPTTFTVPDSFGTAEANGSFVAPREYRFSVGFRF